MRVTLALLQFIPSHEMPLFAMKRHKTPLRHNMEKHPGDNIHNQAIALAHRRSWPYYVADHTRSHYLADRTSSSHWLYGRPPVTYGPDPWAALWSRTGCRAWWVSGSRVWGSEITKIRGRAIRHRCYVSVCCRYCCYWRSKSILSQII